MLEPEYYDTLETRDWQEREIQQFQALGPHLQTAKENAPYFRDILADIDPGAVTSRAALAGLPITSKSDLGGLQRKTPPLAGMANVAADNFLRLYQSPGPTYEPEAAGKDWWRFGRALYATGVRPGDIIHNAFSYHLTPAAMMVETGAQAIGCTVVPAGTAPTEQQLQAISHLRPSVYTGTPSFLKILLDRAVEGGIDVGSLSKALVSGEALPDALRRDFDGHGIRCLQAYASADLGLIAYESKARDGLIVDERIIVEIVRPGSGDPVPDGVIGEVVVTTLNREYPLIRFATGDLSSVIAGVSPCGRTNMRLSGWKGRADQSCKVKGMFVTPSQIAAVVKRHAEIGKARLVVDRQDGKDRMTLICEVAGGNEDLGASIAETLHSQCNLNGAVELVETGSLANDGLVIEDKRAAG
ncbi:MAG: AMP-binding protein [Proteobacteria bacterium]|nr:AMP-binding protein [Pseudomonadota bacterium]